MTGAESAAAACLLRLASCGACLLLAIALASCSGGNALSTLAANRPNPGGPVASKAARVVPASLTFTIPRPSSQGTAHSRKPQYLPATTASVEITLVQVNGNAPSPTPSPTIVTVKGSACTTTGADYICTVPLGLPIGSDALLANAYDAANAIGNLLSSQQSTFTIVASSANNFSMTLDATPGAIVVTPATSAATCSGLPLTCAVLDTNTLSFSVTIADKHGTPLPNNSIAGSPVLSAVSSNIAVATVTATQSPYGISVAPVATGTASIALTASPATGTSGLAATTLTLAINALLIAEVTTFAGSMAYGNADGTKTAASFVTPYGAAVDTAGNVYVADSGNNEIRKVTSAGVVTTLAGSAAETGSGAGLSGPVGVAIDAAGNVYLADYKGNEIQKVTSAGFVTRLAGSTTKGSADGTGTAATFNAPSGVAVGTGGNVYVADFSNNEIRKITAAGVVTTLAGSTTAGSANGSGSAASFNGPFGVSVDTAGNVFVADSGNNEIRKVTSAGVVTTLAGSTTAGSANGTGTAASFNLPFGVAVDMAGNVFVADSNNNEIRKITP